MAGINMLHSGLKFGNLVPELPGQRRRIPRPELPPPEKEEIPEEKPPKAPCPIQAPEGEEEQIPDADPDKDHDYCQSVRVDVTA